MVCISYKVRIPRKGMLHWIELHHISIFSIDDFSLINVDRGCVVIDRHKEMYKLFFKVKRSKIHILRCCQHDANYKLALFVIDSY